MSELPERVMIFVDGSNFYFQLKKLKSSNLSLPDQMNLSLKKLGEKLCGDKRKLIRIYYYNAPLDSNKDLGKYTSQQKWFDKVRTTPDTELVLAKRHKRTNPDGSQYYSVKGDDIFIAVHMLKFAYNNAYDTAILVSGDGDFYPAIRAVKESGKKVEHAYFKSGHSSLLNQECDRNIMIDGFIKEIFD